MTLFDTLDECFMNFAYGGAFARVRRGGRPGWRAGEP